MNHTALVVVDMQRGLVKQHPEEEAVVIGNIAELLELCRSHSVPVLYIAHHEDTGDLRIGTPDWEIIEALHPLENDPRFDKTVCSAFSCDAFAEKLVELGIRELVIVGMRTEFCVDATVKSALARGYAVTIPESCTTSYGNVYLTGAQLCKFYEQIVWKGNGARVIPLWAMRQRFSNRPALVRESDDGKLEEDGI